MQQISFALPKDIKFEASVDLFGNSQPWYAVKLGLCPCGKKLYELKGKNLMICKSKRCGLYLREKKAFVCKKVDNSLASF